MKSALFRKDNMGVIVGRLKDERTLQTEHQGKIIVYNLIGDVIDTEYNDVFVIGERITENTIKVQKMESLPQLNEDACFLTGVGENGPIHAVAISKKAILENTMHESKDRTIYYTIHATLQKNSFIYLNVFRYFVEDIKNDSYVFVLTQTPTETVREFGNGYAKKKQTVKSSGAYQIMS